MILVVSDKKSFENCILKTFFDPLNYLCNKIKTIWIIAQEKKSFDVFLYNAMLNCDPGGRSILTPGA